MLDPNKSFVDINIGTNLTTTTGKNLRVVCPSRGYSNANIEWTINDKNLHYDTRIVLTNRNELIINDLQFFDEGLYKCRVYSQYGFDTMTSQIRVIGNKDYAIFPLRHFTNTRGLSKCVLDSNLYETINQNSPAYKAFLFFPVDWQMISSLILFLFINLWMFTQKVFSILMNCLLLIRVLAYLRSTL